MAVDGGSCVGDTTVADALAGACGLVVLLLLARAAARLTGLSRAPGTRVRHAHTAPGAGGDR